MKVKTHSIKEITWLLSLSPRECLGFRLLQFISFKNKWRGREPSFEFVRKPAPPFSTALAILKTPSSALGWLNFTRFQGREDSWVWFFKKNNSSIKIASFSNTHSLSFSFSPPLPPGIRGILHYMYHTDCSMWGRKEPLSNRPKNKARNLKYFKVIRATNSCLVPNIVLPGLTGHTVATGSGGKSCIGKWVKRKCGSVAVFHSTGEQWPVRLRKRSWPPKREAGGWGMK